jgi:hypothetical protein
MPKELPSNFNDLLRTIDSGILPRQIVESGQLLLSQLKTPDDVVTAVNKIEAKQKKRQKLNVGEMLLKSCFNVSSSAYIAKMVDARPDIVAADGTVDLGRAIGDKETEEISNDTKTLLQDFVLTIHGNWQMGSNQ